MSREDMNKWILDQWDKESLAREWIREHIKYNNMKEDIETFKFTIKTQQQMIDELIGKLDKATEYIKHTQNYGKEKVIYVNGNDLLEILGDKEQEEYTLTKDEEGTTQINGEWYRVDKK